MSVRNSAFPLLTSAFLSLTWKLAWGSELASESLFSSSVTESFDLSLEHSFVALEFGGFHEEPNFCPFILNPKEKDKINYLEI